MNFYWTEVNTEQCISENKALPHCVSVHESSLNCCRHFIYGLKDLNMTFQEL